MLNKITRGAVYQAHASIEHFPEGCPMKETAKPLNHTDTHLDVFFHRLHI